MNLTDKVRQALKLSYPNPGHVGLPNVWGGSRSRVSSKSTSVVGNRAGVSKPLKPRNKQDPAIYKKPVSNDKIIYLPRGKEQVDMIIADAKGRGSTAGLYLLRQKSLLFARDTSVHSNTMDAFLKLYRGDRSEWWPEATDNLDNSVHFYPQNDKDDKEHGVVFVFNTGYAGVVLDGTKRTHIEALDNIFDTLDAMRAAGFPEGMKAHVYAAPKFGGLDAVYTLIEQREGSFTNLSEKIRVKLIKLGGKGSGHFNHKGRVGEQGGSLPSGTSGTFSGNQSGSVKMIPAEGSAVEGFSEAWARAKEMINTPLTTKERKLFYTLDKHDGGLRHSELMVRTGVKGELGPSDTGLLWLMAIASATEKGFIRSEVTKKHTKWDEGYTLFYPGIKRWILREAQKARREKYDYQF